MTPELRLQGRRLVRLLAALATTLLLLAPVEAFAQPRPAPQVRTAPAPVQPGQTAPVASRVGVEVMVVLATNEHDRVDAGLQPFMQHLRFTRYRGFELLDTHSANLGQGQDATFSIPGNRRVKVELLGRDEEQARIRIQLYNQEARVMDTTVNIHRNRSMMIAGPKHGEGVLVLPVTARY